MAYHAPNNHDLVPDLPPVAPQPRYGGSSGGGGYGQEQQQPAGGYQDYEAHSQWDSKSARSYNSQYASSQAHLNPNGYNDPAPYGQQQYEMSQVTLNNNNSHPPAYGQPSQAQPEYPPGHHHPPGPPQRGVQFAPGMPPMRGNSTSSNSGYSAAREQMMRRRSVRQVELQQGNLVLDMPVPASIVPAGAKAEEQTTLRYTAATCDPDEFMRRKYTVRPYLYGRQTELFIVMTMCVDFGGCFFFLFSSLGYFHTRCQERCETQSADLAITGITRMRSCSVAR
jgi:chitin synthase